MPMGWGPGQGSTGKAVHHGASNLGGVPTAQVGCLETGTALMTQVRGSHGCRGHIPHVAPRWTLLGTGLGLGTTPSAAWRELGCAWEEGTAALPGLCTAQGWEHGQGHGQVAWAEAIGTHMGRGTGMGHKWGAGRA